MKIVVLGSGAIGSLYGAFLSTVQSDEVILVGRNPHVAAIKSKGLTIKGVMGEHHFHLKAVDDVSEVAEADLILLTTKTYDTVSAALSAPPIVIAGKSLEPVIVMMTC